MRTTLSLLCLIALLALAAPAQAQLRANLPSPSPVAVYDAEQSTNASAGLTERVGNLLSTAFSDEHFRMSHSYEMSMSSFGGGSSLGMYTNSMQWQFDDAWAARVDMSVAHQPFGGNDFTPGGDGQNMKVFLRNAEVAYRPNENMTFHLQIRQNPYGGYGGPFGGAYGMGPMGFQQAAFARPFAASPSRGGLFWRDGQRN